MAQFPTFDRTELRTNIAALGLDAETHAEYLEIAELVFRGKTNEMRASKPKPGKRTADKADLYGKAAYVWRWIGFHCVRNSQLQCIPCTDTFDLPVRDSETGRWSSKQARVMAKDLDRLVSAFMKTVPLHNQPGTIRWGRALGMIG